MNRARDDQPLPESVRAAQSALLATLIAEQRVRIRERRTLRARTTLLGGSAVLAMSIAWLGSPRPRTPTHAPSPVAEAPRHWPGIEIVDRAKHPLRIEYLSDGEAAMELRRADLDFNLISVEGTMMIVGTPREPNRLSH